MSRWFRYYDEALNDPKVQTLPGELFKTWVNLLSVASKYNGKLPVISELSYLLRRRSDHLQRDLNTLVERGLFDLVGDHLEPHNWQRRQYKSDNSTARVQQHRAEKRNVSCNDDETSTETDTESETEQNRTEKGGANAPLRRRADHLPDEPKQAMDAYNLIAERVGWEIAQRLPGVRRQKLRARLAECGGIEGWKAAMARAGQSDFLTGKIPKNDEHAHWRPTLDFFLQPKSFTRLMEGSYDNRPRTNGQHRTGLAAALDQAREYARGGDFADTAVPEDGRPPGR